LSNIIIQQTHATNPDNYIQGENSSSQYSVQHPLNNIKDNPIPYIEIDNSIPINNNGDTYSNGNNTELDRAQNGTPIIHINIPTEQGVSANYYRDFNVTEENLIFNNHKGQDINTNLGGMIYGNPNFNKPNGKEADIILNEIKTNRQTNINGYVEIAGKKADLIIANPNGIMVSGGGFINTSKLSLITGKSLNGLDENNPCNIENSNNCSSFDLSNNNLNPFQLSTNPNATITVVGRNITDDQGRIVAYNLGIDATNTDYLALISRVVQINGDIVGNNNTEVQIKTGNDKAYYNKDNGFEITSDNTNNSEDDDNNDNINNKPEFAIDSTALGGIYAGKIKIIATEEGVGVRIRKDVVANVDDLDFDLNGNLIIQDSTVSFNKSINIEAKSISNNNNTHILSNDDLTINLQSDYTTKGTIGSIEGTTTLNANNIIIDNGTKTYTITTIITDEDGQELSREEQTKEQVTNLFGYNICLNAKGDITNKDNSTLVANNNLIINALNLYNSDNGTISSNNDITINTNNSLYNGTKDNQGTSNATISAGNNLTITAENKIINYGFLQAIGLYEPKRDNEGNIIKDSDNNILYTNNKIEETGNLTLITKAEINSDYKINNTDANSDDNSNNTNNDEPKPLSLEVQDKLNNLNNITNVEELNELLTLSIEANDEENFYKVQKRIRELNIVEVLSDLEEQYDIDQNAFTIGNTIITEKYNEDTDQTETANIIITEELVQQQIEDVLGEQYNSTDWQIDITDDINNIDNQIQEQQNRLNNYNQQQKEQKQQQYNQDKQTAQESYETAKEYARQEYIANNNGNDDNFTYQDFSYPNFTYTNLTLQEYIDQNSNEQNIDREQLIQQAQSNAEQNRYNNIKAIADDKKQIIEDYKATDWDNISENNLKTTLQTILSNDYIEEQWTLTEFDSDSNNSNNNNNLTRQYLEQLRLIEGTDEQIETNEQTGIHNYGRLYSNNDMTLISNSVLHNNKDSLIYSNNNIDFRINNILFNNAGGGVYDVNNANNNNTNPLTYNLGTGIVSNNNINISGNIYNNNTQQYDRLNQLINYDGRIEANNDINIRTDETINYGSDNINIYKDPYSGAIKTYAYYKKPGVTGQTVVVSEVKYNSTLVSNKSEILANNNITIDSKDSLINYNSSIGSNNNIDLKTDNLINTTAEFTVTNNKYYGQKYRRKKHGVTISPGYKYWYSYYNMLLTPTNAKATLSAKNTLTIQANNITNGSVASTLDNIQDGTLPYSPDNSMNNNNNPNNNPNILNPLNNIQLPTNNYGLYKRVDNPNSNYLYETDPLLIDQTKFLGSQYFMNRIGLDPFSIDQKFLGDAFMEVEMIKRNLEQISYFQHTVISEEEIDKMINNLYNTLTPEKIKGIEDKATLLAKTNNNNSIDQSMVFGKELTPEQINSLEEDIIWYVTKTITLPNGETMEVLVPQVYLCQDTVNKMMEYHINSNTSEILADNIIITSKDNELHSVLNNSGIIKGDKTVVITTEQINNYTSTVDRNNNNGSNNNNINTNDNINNNSNNNQATILAGDLLYLNTVKYETDKDGNYILDEYGQKIAKSGGIINNNSGFIGTTNDNSTVYIATGELNNITHSQIEEHGIKSKEVTYQETKTHIGQAATIVSSGDVIIDTIKVENNNNTNNNTNNSSTGNLNLKGSSIIAKNNIELNIEGDLNSTTVQDYSRVYQETHIDGGTFGTDKTTITEDISLTNIGSNITSTNGTINIYSNNNINLQNTTIDAEQGMTLIADNNINLTTALNYIKTYKSVEKDNDYTGGSIDINSTEIGTHQSTSLISNNGNINLISANDINSISSNIITGDNNNNTLDNQNTGNINLLAGYEVNEEGQLQRATIKDDNGNVLLDNNNNPIYKQANVNLLQSQDFNNTYSYHEEWGGIIDMITNIKIDLSNSLLTPIENISASYDKELDENTTITKTANVNNIQSSNNINIQSSNNITSQGTQLYSNNNINLTAGYTDQEGNKHEGNIYLTSASNSQETKDKHEETTVTMGVKVGNAYEDVYYAGDAVTKAGEQVHHAEQELDKMKELEKQGKASKEAVKDAELNLAMATANLANATIAFASSVTGATSAAATSFGTGFYASAYVNYDTNQSTSNSQSNWQTQSNILSDTGNISFNTNNNMIQEGTNIYATNGTLSYNIENDLTIKASKDTYMSDSKSEHFNTGVSVGNNAVQVSLGGGEASSKVRQTTYNNSDILANNIEINTGNDTTIQGANIEAIKQTYIDPNTGEEITTGGNLIANIGNNLLIESLQDTYYSKSNSWDANIGIGVGTGKGSSNSGSVGFNIAKENTDSQWVNEQTSLTAGNNVNINVNNKTNIIGAVINSETDNLILSTKELNYENLNDFYISESKGFGLSTSIGTGADKKTGNEHPNGSTTLSLKSTGEEKEQETRATIGNGNIIVKDKINGEEITNDNQEQLLSNLNRDINNSQQITRDMITGALDGSMTIDNRLFTEEGRESIKNDFSNLRTNLKIATYGATNTVYNIGKTAYQVATNDEIGITDAVDTWKANQSQQVTALTRGANEKVRETLNNLSEGKDINDIEQSLALGIGEDEKGTKIYYNEETDGETMGFNDKDTKQSYINAGSTDNNGNDIITNTNSIIGADAHERTHTYTDNEAVANVASSSAQTAWTVTNWIYGDTINTTGTATSQSWLNSQLTNTANTTTLLNNTIEANSVAKEDRDNLTIYVHGTTFGADRSESVIQQDQQTAEMFGNAFGDVGEKTGKISWSGENTVEARQELAKTLLSYINNYDFEEGEPLNIIGFSHGGNGVKELTNLDLEKKIDNLVFIATPHVDTHTLNYSNVSENGNIYNFYGTNDGVQDWVGGINTKFTDVFTYFSVSVSDTDPSQTINDQRLKNIEVNQNTTRNTILEALSFINPTVSTIVKGTYSKPTHQNMHSEDTLKHFIIPKITNGE
jgi:filamentous hemagglutinin